AAHEHEAGSESFVERRLGQYRSVTAFMQRLAGTLQAENGFVLIDVQVKTDHGLVNVDAWPLAAFGDELIANSVLDLESRVFGMRDARIAHITVHGQRV